MEKYTFYKIDENNIGLKYKDKEYSFKVNVKMQQELQSTISESRKTLLRDLSKQGESINEYVIVTKKDGKTYYDNSNKRALEEYYREKATLEYFDKFCKENLGKGIEEVIEEIGFDTDKEVADFAKDLGKAMTGKIPSGR